MTFRIPGGNTTALAGAQQTQQSQAPSPLQRPGLALPTPVTEGDRFVRGGTGRRHEAVGHSLARSSRGGGLSLRSGRGATTPGTKPVTAQQIDRSLAGAQARRDVSLKLLFSGQGSKITSNPPPAPEDLSGRTGGYHMAYNSDGASAAYIRVMAEAGLEQGFRIFVTADPSEVGFVEAFPEAVRNNIEIVDVELPANERTPWTEDNAITHRNGQISVVPSLGAADSNAAAVAKQVEQGRSNSLHAEREQVGFALALGKPVRVSLSYMEGGNVLSGTRPSGETYAVVGRGSFAITRALLEQDAARLGFDPACVDDALVRAAMASDLGVSEADLIVVDQPADFHVDVAMTAWTPGVMLLNDPQAAIAVQVDEAKARFAASRPTPPADASSETVAAYARADTLIQAALAGGKEQIMALRQFADDNAALLGSDVRQWINGAVVEAAGFFRQQKSIANSAPVLDAVAKQMEEAGLQVVRVPGRYADAMGTEVMNLMNAEGGTGAGDAPYLITQEMPESRRQAFLGAIANAGLAVPTLYEIPDDAARASLANSGSINCRTNKVPLDALPRR